MRGAEAIKNRYLSSKVLATTMLLAGISLLGCNDSSDRNPPGKSEISTESEPQNKSETTTIDGVTYLDDGTATFRIRVNGNKDTSIGFETVGATCLGRVLMLGNSGGYGSDIEPVYDHPACADGKITFGELTDLEI